MYGKQRLLLIDNQGKGAFVYFPEKLPAPAHQYIRDKKFVKTDRTRTTIDGTSIIYTEINSILNLDDYANDKPEEETEEEA